VTRRLAWVVGLTAGYALAEVAGGWLANSLALLADAGHMLTDVMALSLALLAAWTARRPPDDTRTYGYQRVEILAALFNGVALIVIAVFIFVEAWQRLWSPPEVAYGLMAGVAFGGMLVNLAGIRILGGHTGGLNVRAAYLHLLGDLLGSIGALTAAGAMAFFGWFWADAAASVLIGGFIVFGAIRLVLAAVNVLLEGAPAHLDADAIRGALRSTPGVCEVLDLHLWSLGGGDSPLLSAHLVLDHSAQPHAVLRAATDMLRQRFAVTHATLQLEPPDFNIIQSLTGNTNSARD